VGAASRAVPRAFGRADSDVTGSKPCASARSPFGGRLATGAAAGRCSAERRAAGCRKSAGTRLSWIDARQRGAPRARRVH